MGDIVWDHVLDMLRDRSAMLVHGKDTCGYWLPEMRPKADLDPDCVAELDRVFTLYKMAPERRKKAS